MSIFRLRFLTPNATSGLYEAATPLTGGIVKSLSWWTPDALSTWSGALWELDPSGAKPPRLIGKDLGGLNGFEVGPGGKGSNAAVAAARQGARVAVVARIGRDDFGRMALALWAREGIATEAVAQAADAPSGVAQIFTYPDGDNYVCADCGHEWPQLAAVDGDEEGDSVVKDANGQVLADGDAVVLIKDLKVKGSSITLKMGTKVKSIRLPEGAGDHDVRPDHEHVDPGPAV